MRLLDIDLDAFLNDTAFFQFGDRRLDSKHYRPWSERRLRIFLEGQCGLSRDHPLPGRYAVHHDAAFDYWKELLSANDTGASLDVVHVDGHADLGLGDPSWIHLVTEHLHRPVSQRSTPPRGTRFLNPGSYLAYAIAARWINSLVYVYPRGGGHDVPIFYLMNNSRDSGHITLKAFTREFVNTTMNYPDMTEIMTSEHACSVEPPVPFSRIRIENFVATAPFDYGFLCQSPGFTPKKSDTLIPVIREYIQF